MSRRESVIATGGSDPRKAYLLKVASHILSLNLTEERLPNGAALNAFCNTDIPILAISRLDQKGHVEVGNELNNQKQALLRVIFYKIQGKPLSLDDYKNNVTVLSMHENAGETLLGTLKQVFKRLLANGHAEKVQMSNLLGELEEQLQSSLGVNDGTTGGETGAVHSLRSEIELWQRRAQKGTEPAQSYSEALEPLAEKMGTLEGDCQLEELYEILELAEQSVDALWNVVDDPYPQRRMRQLLICIGDTLCAAIARQVVPEELFRSPENLRLILSLITQWRDTVQLLTSKSWPQNGLHPWEGAPLSMDQFERFLKRMEEAHSLATLGEQIARLMSGKDVYQQDQTQSSSTKEEVLRAIESAMSKVNLFEFGPRTEQQWRNKLAAAERVLDPYIERILPALQEKILPNGQNDDQEVVIEELYRYRHFLSRKQVKTKLQAERQTLITRLAEQLSAQRRDIERIQNSTNIPMGRFLTEIAAKISWLRSNLSQVEKLRKTAAIFFDDLPSFAPFEQNLRALAEELKMAEQENFDAWCRDMIAHVDDQNGDSISLQTTGRLMILERARGILNVSYSDRLARLLREVAQLESMGFKIPSKILQCAQQGEKFYQYGVLLKQVAHFYNTIEQQMLPCQQAMLLDEALAFERLVVPSGKYKNDERAAVNLTWENPEKLKAYIEKLREAAFKLTTHNRRLRKAHTEIEQIVLQLGETDLLREEEKWTNKLIEIRQKFVDEERFVAVKANMQPWVNHWNRQLYKVVQLQFRWALENLQSQIPTMNAQLVFRDQQLQLRPPLEELKQTYYKALRKLLSTPQRLRGVQNNAKESELFARIVAKNSQRFQSLFEQSELMFERLKTIGHEFDEWLALAQVNLEDLLEQHLHSAADWEEQLRQLRLKQREAERMPNEIRIECVRVSTIGVRALIDDLLKRFHDALAWTLRHSIRSEQLTIEQKLSQGIKKLSELPQNLDEVAEANQTQLTLARSAAQFRTRMTVMEEKDQFLRSLFGSDQGVEGIQALRDQFMQFLSILETHELVMREQVQTMKTNVGQTVKKLGEELEKLHSLWNQFKPRSEIFTSQDDRMALLRAVEFIREKRQEFETLSRKLDKVRTECEQFELEQPEWPLLAELKEDLEQFESNYLLYEDFSNELQPLADQEWVLFRSKTYLFDEFLQTWLDKLKATTGSNVAIRLQRDIEQMKEFSNCLKFCRGEVFSADHWLEMFRLLGLPRGTSLERLTFGALLQVQQKVVGQLEKLKELNARAHGEISIREAIQELEMWAAQAEFTLNDYKHASGAMLKVVKEWKPVLDQVRDNQALLQSLRSSAYYAQFREQIQLWEKKVADLEQCLHHLNEIQRKWVYLEPIFGRGSLPSEAARFNRIDVEFRVILGDIAKDSRIAALIANNPSLGRTLEQLVDQLNRCQRALNEFLEEKRSAFPRFYFLGDDDLLEIVGQSTNPAVIQSHLKKLFQGINRVAFDAQQQSIRAMISVEGETVQLMKPVQIVPKVEHWLSALSEEMRNTLRKLVVDCLQERSLDPSRYPSQVLCLSEQIRFCSDVEKCLASLGGSPADQLAAYRRQLLTQLEKLSSTIVEDTVLQLKLKALVLDLIHHISVLDQLIQAENNQSIGCWTWQRQLRFYLVKSHFLNVPNFFQVSGLVVVRQAEYEFPYTYEYQGNAQKLVHTPLTDKCYLTLTQALAMGLGGNPYGPAGTGKTESVKALAGLMGRQVLVFNCDEGIDVRAIGRIFVGLIQCGAWGCFDEFNRLAKGVLSAVSSQVQLIQEAVRTRATHCRIGDHSVPVDTNSAIFVTLNPAGKGYGGRQRLPDNLKQLFRPVVMSVPDNEQIAETLLFAEGFSQAKILAKKLVTTFLLAKEMLSAQQHYDWGLRALKTVLKGCADAIAKKRLELKAQKQRLSAGEEFELAVQNVQLNTLSKLTFADARRFRVLLEDIFSGVQKEAMQFNELRPHLEIAAQQMQMTITEVQMNKLFELYEQLRQRIGVIIVGPPGSGKSTLWRLLQIALSSSGSQSVDVYSMNPKAMARSRLLGHMEPDTREWADGILTHASRMATKDPGKPAWIVCDGDVDPEWIEALNSVLDDNKLLTIPSGERIQFGENVNFLFECVDLSHASPATISRMGMILVSREDLDMQELIKRFLIQNEKDLPVQFPDWVNTHLLPALDWTFAHQYREFASSQVGIIENALSLVKTAKSKNQFLVNTFRALLPYVEPDARRELSERVIFTGLSLPDPKAPLNVYCDSRTDTLLSYTDDIGLPLSLEEIRKVRPVVMTARMQSARDTLLEWLQLDHRAKSAKSKHILLIGPDGCGKECLLRSCFFDGAVGAVQRKKLVTMHCGAQTSAQHLEQLLFEHCVQISGSKGRVLKPKEHEQLVLHLKSANLSATDAYGTSMLIAFLEQMLDYNGFYDHNLEWIGMENVQLVVSISVATGAERFTLPERFASKLRVLALDAPNEAELRVIYGTYLAPILGQTQANRSKSDSVAISMASVFMGLAKTFTASEQFHYVFTPIDLTNWLYALLRYELSSDADFNACINFEAQRIFSDRLVNADHRLRLQSLLQEHFPIRDRPLFVPSPGPLVAKEAAIGKPMMQIGKPDYYLALLEKSANRLKAEQDQTSQQPLNDAFVEMCLAVDRKLTAPGGSVLLAGQAGMGRRAAVALVAQIHQMRLSTLRVSSAYTLRNFSQDLRDAIHFGVVDNEQVVLLVEDYQLLDESFLQFLNALIASGNVPGLYSNQQELEQILTRLRDSAMDEGFAASGSLHDFFAHKVRQNVHVALLMNIGHPNFASRIQSNPSLYKHCSIIWQENWSTETLTQIATMAFQQRGIESPAQWLLGTFAEMFQKAPEDNRNPAKFSVFVENFHELMQAKKSTIEKRLQRLKAGVDKLTETKTAVAKLQKKAAKKSKLLAEKQEEANHALAEITRSMSGATEQKSDMEQLKSATEAENVKIEEQKKLIEQQLSEVEPLLREAREAVGSIKTESLTEVRSLRAPPEAIRDILQAVLLFMGILDTSWEAMRKFLAKSGVKEDIINFDARRITPDMAKKVGALVRSKAASFDPKNAKRASAAAAPLAAWVTANLQYALIIEKIAPLEKKKDTLVKNLSAAERQMDQLSKGLKSLDKKVDELKANFEVCMKEATEIKIELDREQATIVVAGKLVERLGGEYTRWQQQMKQLEMELRTVESCCLIGAAFITFLGGASEELRSRTMEQWKMLCQLPEGFDLLCFQASETEQLGWKAEGIPSNRLALENAAILFRSKETPFIIDPSGAISAFLANHFKTANAETLRANQTDLMTQIELGVRFGKTLIVDEVDNGIEPALIPLLRKEFKSVGTRLAVQLGEKQAKSNNFQPKPVQVDFNEKFRLFLCTRNEHCRLPEHARGALAEINFSITRSGLASQLLGLAIQMEKPELEQSSAQLSSQVESLKMQLDQMEQVLLEELAVSTGSLLENTSLLESLNQSKEKADKVADGLAESQKLRAQIDSQRDVFLPFAKRCAQLYFAIRPLHSIKQCYQFSVNDCVRLFRKCFQSGDGKTGGNEERLERTFRRLRLRLFEFVSRALFKEDRLMFAMQYVHETAPTGLFGRQEWELFTGVLLAQSAETASNALISQIGWLEREKRLAVEKIQTHLPTLFQTMQIGDQQTWAGFMKSTECENAYPPSVNSKLTEFQRLLVLQALRPDRLHAGIIRFASKQLGVESLNAPNLDFALIHRDESTKVQPILFLIAPGSSVDPSAELIDFAQKHFGAHRLHQMALGQAGSDWTVLDQLKKCTRNGDWLCLHNVHLVPAITGKLLAEVGSAEKEGQLNTEFRLWLTAEPDDQLPVVFLQSCLKATYETPPGIRKNLERNYCSQTGNEAERNVPKLKAVFLLHWLHAVSQERRNFIPQAWLKFYEFSGADLRAAKHSLDSQFAIKEKANLRSVDWEQFRGLMMNAIYGGRIEVELDNRVLHAFLVELFNVEMVDGTGGELVPGLKTPTFGQHQEYAKWVESTLPVTDRAELLSLPRNIMLSWDLAQSANVVSKLRLLFTAMTFSQQLPASVGSHAQQHTFNRQLWADALNPLLNHWKKFNQQNPGLLQAAQEQKNRPISAGPGKRETSAGASRVGDDPLAEILQLEFVYALKLMQSIHSSLSAISWAIKGTQLPEKKTLDVAQALLLFQIPSAWDSLWSGPSVPTQYLEALVFKAKSTQAMQQSAQSKQLLSSSVNLAQLFRPGTLLNAFRQYSARKLNVSMDELKLGTSWHNGQNGTNSGGGNAPTLTLSNLRIQGALFDGNELRTVPPSAAPFAEVPNLDVYWTNEAQNIGDGQNFFDLPLFADPARQELILQIALPCPAKMQNAWIMAGIALFLSQN